MKGQFLIAVLKSKVNLSLSLFVKCLFDAHFFTFTVACNIGDWVQVECDYSPGICSEGGTGVVIAKNEGKLVEY